MRWRFRQWRALVLFLVTVLFGLGVRYWAPVATTLGHWYYGTHYLGQPKRVYASRVEKVEFDSTTLGVHKDARVYLPAAYDQDVKQRFPVVYLLHGFPGSNEDWLINTNLQTRVDEMIGSGAVPPLIIVFPDGNGPVVSDSQYLNATVVHQPMEDYLVELVHCIDGRYRTQPDRTKRAIGGLSSGAYGAMNIGFHQNSVFGFVFSHSGYFVNREGVLKKLLGKDQAAIKRNNPLDYLATAALDPHTFVYIDIGRSDNKRYLQESQDMEVLLVKKGIPHTVLHTSGGHSFEVWAANIDLSLHFLATYLRS